MKIIRYIVLLTFVSLFGLFQGLQAQPPGNCATPRTTPVAGTATVNTDYTEWNLANDFFACMYTAGNSTKPLLSKAYLRHDCNTNRVYVLVLKTTGTVNMSGSDAWVRLPSHGRSTVVSGSNVPSGTGFSWVYDNGNSSTGTLMGFEAYFTRVAPFSDDIEIHLNIDGETSSTGKISQNNAIPFSIACGTTCNIDIDKIMATGCSGGTHDLQVRVNYNNAPAGSDIEILTNGTIHTFTPSGGTNGCEMFAVNGISCSGPLTVEARFKTNTGCSDQVTYTPNTTPPSDPQGFIYCEETGEIITGGTIEVVAPNNGTVVQINLDGSNGEYQFDVLAGPYGDFGIVYNPPSGYALSTLHTASTGPLDLTTANGGSDIFLGQDENAAGTALDGFNTATYQTDNPFYTLINIDASDPNLFRNNIPLSGCTAAPPPSCVGNFSNPGIASPFSPPTIPCPPPNAANQNDEDLCQSAPAYTAPFFSNCNGTGIPQHSMWLKFILPQNAPTWEMQVVLNGTINGLSGQNIYWELHHSTVAGVDNPASLTPYIPNGGSSQICGTQSGSTFTTYNSPAIGTTGDVYIYLHIYTDLVLTDDVNMNVKIRNACPLALCTLTTGASATDASCNAGSDGTATAATAGGAPPYTYSWSNGQTTQTATGLSAGTYTVTVTDAANCTASASAAVGEPSAVSVVVNTSNASCGTNNGSAFASANGGTPGYTYLWNTGATGQSLSNLGPGTYTVTATDANGCTATDNGMVTQPTGFTASASGTDVTCNGGTDGTATANVVGGTAPFTYSWSNGGTTAGISGLSAGTYTVNITDINGCTGTASVTVNEPPATTTTAGSNSPVCEDGPINLTSGSGVSHSWTSTTGFTSNDQNPTILSATLADAGTYTVEVTDANGCTATASTSVTVNPTPDLSVNSPITNVCPSLTVDLTNTAVTGLVDNNATGGTITYHTVPNPANGTSNTVGDPTAAAPGNTYWIRSETANGCVDIVPIVVNRTPCYAIGNMVWNDNGSCSTGEGNNGQYDAGSESGINGVIVSLFRDNNSNGLADGPAIASDVTANGGFYLFDGLDAGNYLVRVNGSNFAPAGPLNGMISSTFTEANPNNDVDNNDNGRNGAFSGGIWSRTITLGPTEPTGESPLEPGVGQGASPDNEANMTIDFGFVGTGSFGDYVWEDLNHDGLQGSPLLELPVQGVSVSLYQWNSVTPPSPFFDVFIGTQITDVDGNYLFENLVPCRNYYVQFNNLPQFYELTHTNQGSDDETDSDPNKTTRITVPTTIGPGENDLSWDAGIYLPKASIGDRVWNDTNENGRQDAGEAGVPGVTVSLYYCGGPLVAQTTTGPTGLYSFTNLNPGFYYVEFSNLPPGFVFTSKDTGTNDANDSDADPVNGQAGCTLLSPYENDLNWDAGIYVPKASLGDRVWNDDDEDGYQDPNEPGVPGVTVTLFTCAGAQVATTSTNAQGYYLFENLMPGSYYVQFSNLPVAFTFSPKDNVVNDDVNDSDAGSNGKTSCITLAPGQDERDVDAGIHLNKASIGDKVWEDLNENGIQDPGEPGVAGVHVVLKRVNSPIGHLDTTQTDMLGHYYFYDVTPGDYCIIFYNLPADYVASPQDVGSNDNVDSDPSTATLKTTVTTLDPGEDDPSWDLGIYLPKASLGDRVWNDEDEDGIQDPGESGVQGVRVELYTCGNAFVGFDDTDASGNYHFDNLTPGDYYVVFKNLPAGYVFSPKDAATSDAVDSDADASGKTACTQLDPGEHDGTLDGGIYLPKASIGDCVWNDDNQNGIQDPGENGVAGITVTLYDGSGNAVASQTTNLLGKYLFDNLTPGDYSVKFTNLVPGWVFTQQDAGSNDAVDSDVDPNNGCTPTTTLSPNEDDMSWDAGIYLQKATLGNLVWNDIDEDGEQDSGESGVSGVSVSLYDCGGNFVRSTTTDADGEYWFTDLIPGSYYVVFSGLPTDFVFSPANSAGDAVDSDAGTNGQTACVSLAPGETNSTVDAGIYLPKATLGDKVFEDGNNNGIQDAGENGVFGVKVSLYSCGGVYQTHTFTDASGEYLFEDLAPGSYYVVFSDLPFNYAFSGKDAGSDDNLDSDADASGQTACVTLASGETNLSVDAGIFTSGSTGPNARIGSRVWDDTDEDGEQDPNEPGIENVKVTLYDCSGNFVAQQYTDGNGDYLFTNLASGSYYVKFEDITAGYSFTAKDQGSDDANDSDADSNGQTACISLLPGESNLTVDAGLAADRVSVCTATDFNASGHGLLFTSGSYPGSDNRYGFDSNGGQFITYANGTARLLGTLVNKSNPNLKFCVEFRMINRKDWGQWSAQGGLAKGSHLGPYMTWDYYEVDAAQSRLIGKDGLAGEVLALSHMPANLTYGPQVGDGANDRNANYGMSGWWFFSSVSGNGNFNGTGDFNLNLDNCQHVMAPGAQPKLGAMALLQGAYDASTGVMRTDLKTQGLLPASQPFNAAPWNYAGTETLGTTAPDSVVDWVLIELRDANNTQTILSRQAGVLVKNGQLVQPDGFSLIELPQNVTNFYLVIYNWNHLSVMSSQPLQKYGNVYFHDFSAGLSGVHLDPSLSSQPAFVNAAGKTLLFEGDATGDELINSIDLGQVLLNYFNAGSSATDVNMDGVVNSIDVGRAMQNYFIRSHVPR